MCLITTALLLLNGANAAQQAEPPRWDFSRTNRYYLETNVQLPIMMWWMAEYNKQARVDYFELEIVTECAPGVRETRRTWEVMCIIEDLAVRAAPLPQEAGIVAHIVEDIDRRLTGARVQLQIRDDGRITNIDLEDVGRRNRRFGRINENMRLVLTRAFSGLDQPLPAGDEEGWIQHSSWIMRAPAADGSSGSSEIVHKIVDRTGSVLTIAAGGRGMIVPGEGINKYDARFTSEATFDARTGRLLDRTWTLVGGPTASSLIASGTEGFPYLQRGRIVALSEGQSWEIGETAELEPRASQTAIQQDQILGVPLQR